MSDERSLVIAALRGSSQNSDVVAGTRREFAALADQIAAGTVVVWPADTRSARAELLLDAAQGNPTSTGTTAAIAALTQATLAVAEQTQRMADLMDRIVWQSDSASGNLLVSVQS